MATKNEVDAAETAPTTATTTVVTPRTQRTGPLLAVIGGSALAAALLLGGGVLLGFNLGHADHQPRVAQELLPGINQGPLMNGPRSDSPRGGDLRETGPRQAPQQNQQPVKPDTDSN